MCGLFSLGVAGFRGLTDAGGGGDLAGGGWGGGKQKKRNVGGKLF